MSTISSITLLNKFNVKEVGSLQEKLVHIGMKEAVKLLKTSLYSKKVLTGSFNHYTTLSVLLSKS
ncbi:hypothetical protein ACJIZ3_017308 [Penstemon smallii]|uniref:Uncharacterized protein n=1 Tax=Penstemon smallii TaxID=265156 RepID=A0ABD3SVX9_9LAMI